MQASHMLQIQTSHVISDAILALTGFFVFYKYLLKLNFAETLLWEAYVLSVSIAAVLGALGFAQITDFNWLAAFFKDLATIVGVIALVGGTWFLVNNQTPNRNIAFGILAVGFILLAVKLFLNFSQISQFASLGGMLSILLIAVYGIIKGNRSASFWILIAVILPALINFRTKAITDYVSPVDLYHYLMALSLLCFGMACSKRTLS